jgi:cyclophilin family peptidyl-prolyl cis-trans isomerase
VFRNFTALTTLSVLAFSLLAFGQNAVAKPAGADKQLIAAKGAAQASNDPIVIMETSKGTIKMQIFRKDAPITAGNFIDLVQKSFYNGLKFHRYEPGFCIQGGDPQGTGGGGYVDPQTHQERTIPLEIKPNLKHDLGAVAMARTSNPNSASSQFYIALSPVHQLDGNYAVFGKVIDGMPAVMALRAGDKIVKTTLQEPGSK